MTEIKIDPEFKNLIPPLTDEEHTQLEESLVREGCRDSLVVWQGTLIDGHNRYEICQKHDLLFKTIEKEFADRDAAKIWIVTNQLGRRNLTTESRNYLIGKLYSEMKKQHGGERKASGQNVHLTTHEIIAEQFKVSPKTVQRAEIYAKDLDTLSPETRKGVLNREIKLKDVRTEQRQRQIREGTIVQNVPTGEFNVIYADPPWKYDFAEAGNREIENQYPTMGLASLKEIILPLAENAVLFLWATAPKLEEALQVLNAWGFTYKTCAVWDKEIIGMGYWFRGQHELLLVATRGSFPAPLPEVRISSVFREKRSKHSQKPEGFYKIIESMCPGAQYLEVFARHKREGWANWGNETL